LEVSLVAGRKKSTRLSLLQAFSEAKFRGIETTGKNKKTLIHEITQYDNDAHGSGSAEGARRECIETTDVSLPRAEPDEDHARAVAGAVALEEAEAGDGEPIVAGNSDVDLGHIPVCKIVERDEGRRISIAKRYHPIDSCWCY